MTTTDCDLWNDVLASPRSFGDLDQVQLDALASHVDACPRCRDRAAATPPQADVFALLARDSTGHAYDAEFAQDVEALLAEQQDDTAAAVTEVLYPAFRGTSGAAQMEQVRAALASHPQPELALWRSIDAVALLVRRYAHQERPPRQWLRDDGSIDLGDGDEIPATTLAAEMARSAGVRLATAHLIVGWLPDAVRRVPTLFRGLEATPVAADDPQPPMALRWIPRDNLEPLAVRWQPRRAFVGPLNTLVEMLWIRASTIAARQGDASAHARAVFEEVRVVPAGRLDQIALRSVLAFVAEVADRTDNAAERRALREQMEACSAAIDDVVRTLATEDELRHEQSGDW